MSMVVYGVEVWLYPKASEEQLHHWTDKVFTIESKAREYADAQEAVYTCPYTGEKWEQDWEVIMLILEEE